MNIDRETVIRLGEQSCDVEIDHRGRKTYSFDDYGLERFAALVLEHGRKPLTEMDRVTAERDALKVDAERYRYLRANAADSHMWNDESIDAAIRASKGEK